MQHALAPASGNPLDQHLWIGGNLDDSKAAESLVRVNENCPGDVGHDGVAAPDSIER